MVISPMNMIKALILLTNINLTPLFGHQSITHASIVEPTDGRLKEDLRGSILPEIRACLTLRQSS
jgi:hypothetical protein